jgi:hypothetical protein
MTANRNCRGLFLAVVLLLLVPVALVEYVPMVDLPGHLARVHILRNYDQVPQFRETYALTGKLIPNLVLDLILVPLTHVVSLYQASRIFVALGMAVFALGCWTVSQSVYGRITPLAVLALFLQYNSTFFFGFVAFQFSVGLMLLTLGLWYRWRAQWSMGRLGVLMVLGVLIYLSHLGGYMYLGIALGWLTLRIWIAEKRISLASLAGLLPLLPPLLIYLSAGTVRGQANEIVFSNLSQKALHAGMLLIGYDRRVDALVAVLLMAAAAAVFWYGKVRLQPEMGSLGGVFFFAFLVMPWMLLTGSDADTRMMLGAGVFGLLALTIEIPAVTGKWIYGVALAALVTRIVFCGWVWTQQSEFIAGHVAFLDRIPQGARLFPVMRLPEEQKANKFERVLTHIPDLASVRRNAIVPTVFAVAGQHSLTVRTPRWVPNSIEPSEVATFDWDRVSREYDTIWQYGQDPLVLAILEKRFRQIGQHGQARLYQIQ